MSSITGWTSKDARQPLELITFDVGPLGAEEVEVTVDCGSICHCDLSMIHNEWCGSRYPFTPGHVVIGRVTALSAQAKGLTLGQRVGIGRTVESCMHCQPRCSGDLGGRRHARPAVLVTVNVAMDWSALFNILAPKGRMHMVGAMLEPIPVPPSA